METPLKIASKTLLELTPLLVSVYMEVDSLPHVKVMMEEVISKLNFLLSIEDQVVITRPPV